MDTIFQTDSPYGRYGQESWRQRLQEPHCTCNLITGTMLYRHLWNIKMCTFSWKKCAFFKKVGTPRRDRLKQQGCFEKWSTFSNYIRWIHTLGPCSIHGIGFPVIAVPHFQPTTTTLLVAKVRHPGCVSDLSKATWLMPSSILSL